MGWSGVGWLVWFWVEVGVVHQAEPQWLFLDSHGWPKTSAVYLCALAPPKVGGWVYRVCWFNAHGVGFGDSRAVALGALATRGVWGQLKRQRQRQRQLCGSYKFRFGFQSTAKLVDLIEFYADGLSGTGHCSFDTLFILVETFRSVFNNCPWIDLPWQARGSCSSWDRLLQLEHYLPLHLKPKKNIYNFKGIRTHASRSGGFFFLVPIS